MLQFIGVIVLLVVGKWFYDNYLKDPKNPKIKPKKDKKGQVIDVSGAWIDTRNLPYRKKDQILSGKDLALYALVCELIKGNKYMAYPHVYLSQLLSVPVDVTNREEYYQRVRDKLAEVVIFELPELKPRVVLIQENPQDIKRKKFSDSFTKNVLESASLPFVAVNMSDLPSSQTLAAQLQAAGLEIAGE